MLERLRKIKDIYTHLTVGLCAIICWVILLSFALQVICRYLLNASFFFTEDVTVIGMLWIMAVGISIGTLHHDHFLINVIYSLLSNKGLARLQFIIDILLTLFGVGMVYFGNLSLQANKGFTQSMLGFDESFRYLPVVVGGVLTILAGIECIIEQILAWKHGDIEDTKEVTA